MRSRSALDGAGRVGPSSPGDARAIKVHMCATSARMRSSPYGLSLGSLSRISVERPRQPGPRRAGSPGRRLHRGAIGCQGLRLEQRRSRSSRARRGAVLRRASPACGGRTAGATGMGCRWWPVADRRRHRAARWAACCRSACRRAGAGHGRHSSAGAGNRPARRPASCARIIREAPTRHVIVLPNNPNVEGWRLRRQAAGRGARANAWRWCRPAMPHGGGIAALSGSSGPRSGADENAAIMLRRPRARHRSPLRSPTRSARRPDRRADWNPKEGPGDRCSIPATGGLRFCRRRRAMRAPWGGGVLKEEDAEGQPRGRSCWLIADLSRRDRQSALDRGRRRASSAKRRGPSQGVLTIRELINGGPPFFTTASSRRAGRPPGPASRNAARVCERAHEPPWRATTPGLARGGLASLGGTRRRAASWASRRSATCSSCPADMTAPDATPRPAAGGGPAQRRARGLEAGSASSE